MTNRELIEKLYELEGPARDIDRAIAAHLGKVHTDGVIECAGYIGIASFTGSIDDAVRLCEYTLPGWIWRIATCSVSDDAWVMPDFNHPTLGVDLQRRYPEIYSVQDPLEYLGTDIDLRPSGRPAIALCIAILTAVDKIAEASPRPVRQH